MTNCKFRRRLAASLKGFVAFYLTGCSAVTPRAPGPVYSRNGNTAAESPKNSDASALDPTSWEKRFSGLKEDAEKVSEQLTEVNSQLTQISIVKEALCDRQTELLSSCIVHAPLSGSTWQSAASCRANKSVNNGRGFTAEIRGISGKFQLILDNSIESNVIEPEKTVTLQWKSRGSRSLKDLKLSDVGSIKLKALEGNLKELQSAVFSFKVDDSILLTEQDFLLATRTDTAVMLSQLSLTNELSSTDCRVDDSEIDETVKIASKKIQVQPKVETPSENLELSAELRSQNLEKWITESRNEYQSKSDTYLALAQDVSRLRRNLRGELQLGCWSRETIKTIEIGINGSALPLSDWDRSQAREPLGVTGQPAQTTIDFGGGLRFTNPDEKTSALFRDGGRWLLQVNTDLTLGDISNIQIQKDGYSYESIQNCWSTWAGLGKACEWQNRENNRYKMNNLTVKINGVIAYQKEAINAVFERSSLKWIESDLTRNPAYVDLMRRRDCPVSTGSN